MFDSLGRDTIAMQVTQSTHERLEKEINQIRSLEKMEENWDSYGAPCIHTDAMIQSIYLLSIVFGAYKNAYSPMLVPTTVGGVQLEWD